jgi:hypothetical protein
MSLKWKRVNWSTIFSPVSPKINDNNSLLI